MSQPHKINKTDAEWQAELTPQEYAICRQKGTEPAFTGIYNKYDETGVYRCKCCDALLFRSDAKYDSGSGWPSFYATAVKQNVAKHVDKTHGMVRTEITCAVCDSHLGHVFPDGPAPTGMRFCVNSASLNFSET